MSSPQKTTSDLEAVADALRSHDRFLLVTHENPDGDALGSLLATKLALDALGKDSEMYLYGDAPLPHEYSFMPLEGPREQLQLGEVDRFVDALEDAVDVGAGLDQLRGQPEGLRRRVRVLETPGVGHERDVERLCDLRGQLDAELREEVAQDLARRGSVTHDEVQVAEA